MYTTFHVGISLVNRTMKPNNKFAEQLIAEQNSIMS